MRRHPLYFEYAVPLNKNTFGPIVAYAESYNRHIANEFNSILMSEGHLGLMANMVFDVTEGVPESFSVFPKNTFDACWRYGDGQRGPFVRIHKNRY